MKLKSLTTCSAFWLGALLTPTLLSPLALSHAQEQGGRPTTESRIADIEVPGGAKRLPEREMPDIVRQGLKALVTAGGPKLVRGQNEVLVWPSNARKAARLQELKAQLKGRLEAAGWTCEETAALTQFGGSIPILAVHLTEPRKGLVGLWTPTDARILLSWTEMLPGNAATVPSPVDEETAGAQTQDAGTETYTDEEKPTFDPDHPNGPDWETPPPKTRPNKPANGGNAPAPPPAGSTVLELAGSDKLINVMKGVAPKIPVFPKIAPKKGFVRGFVKNSQGKPLAGALIGVRSSAIGGAYSGASGKTDANGYYEISVPWGACEFYCAGYTVNWGESRAALGLHPANGEAGTFASANGYVQNWVLLMHGVGNRDALVDQPQNINAYYGGTISISYFVADPRFGGYDKALPEGSKIRLTLSPKGLLFDGSKGRTFVISQPVTDTLVPGFKIMNLPLGEYTLKAELIGNGKTATLKMREAGPQAGRPFGLSPKQTPGAGTITFRPMDATPNNVAPAHGHWDPLSVLIEPQG